MSDKITKYVAALRRDNLGHCIHCGVIVNIKKHGSYMCEYHQHFEGTPEFDPRVWNVVALYDQMLL